MSIEQQAKQWMKEKYKDMEMNDYQRKSVEFAIYPHSHSILYPALGLAGEAGEVANKVKKFIRDGYDQENSCLLYTSPSPRDGLLSRMPSSA